MLFSAYQERRVNRFFPSVNIHQDEDDRYLVSTGTLKIAVPRCSRQAARRLTITAALSWDLARALARALAWVTDTGCILILAFFVHVCPYAATFCMPGFIAAVIALFTDCWQMLALGHPQSSFESLTPFRTLWLDLVCQVVSMGDVILILMLEVRVEGGSIAGSFFEAVRAAFGSPRSVNKWPGLAVFSLTLVMWKCLSFAGIRSVCWS
ncbi:hypothetical protein CP532_0070 [Ophiocordyceps camponoti-leonardi (nom. inval.)]|nr:hypothetical protein CP532_0070 [Ophiocordyceps camponoti-leonardi (nom. inval.)]